MPVYALFGGVREPMVLLCCASQASSGDHEVNFVRATVALVVSSSLPQRRGSSVGVLLVENWRNGTLPSAQRRATEAESALRHCLANADIDVDGVTGILPIFPQAQLFRHRDRHELGCTTGRIRGTTNKTRVVVGIFSLVCLHFRS